MRKPRRRHVHLAIVVSLVTSAGVAAALGRWTIFGLVGTLGVVSMLIAGAALGVSIMNMVQRVEKRQRLAGASMGKLSKEIAELSDLRQRDIATMESVDHRTELGLRTLAEGAEEHERLLGDLGAEVSQLSIVLGAHGQATDGPAATLAQRFERLEASVLSVRQYVIAECDALAQVRLRFPMAGRSPVLSGWAMRPRGMLQVLDLIETSDATMVVECGSGASTIYMAHALKSKGRGRLVALEHLEDVAASVEEQLERHGLSDWAAVRLAPLVPIELDGSSYSWYDLAVVPDVADIDLLVVDGPPAKTGALARLPAVPLLRERMSNNAHVVLDDADRVQEREVLRRWELDAALEQTASTSPDQAVLVWREHSGSSRMLPTVSEGGET